jgi:lysophospholipase L1-like esterase
MIWLEGINDFSKNGTASVQAAQDEMKAIVARVREKIPGIRIYGATAPSALNSTNAAHGFPEQDDKRKALNTFIRTARIFDGVVDFEKATLNTATNELKADMVPESTTGGPGDKLHPNRAGYLAMGNEIDIDMLMGKKKSMRAAELVR